VIANFGALPKFGSYTAHLQQIIFLLDKEKEKMADKNEKKVTAITSMEEDFAQWYTDVVKKADLIDYSSVRGCMIFRPYSYAIWELIQKQLDERLLKTYTCLCLYPKVFCRKKKTMLRALHRKLLG
jgi:hypothetical protein